MAYPSADSRYRERRGTANSSNPVAMLERRSTSNSVLDGGGLKEKILGYVKSGCKTLDLSSRGIITLPPEISLLSNLTRLYLDHNQLEALPPEFSALISLEELDLSHNQLKAFPREIFNLTNLKKLRLSYNNISKFSSGIKKLTKLRVLNLFQNELTYIPQELREMTHIQELYIGNNGFNLSNFPEASEAKGIGGLLKLSNAVVSFARRIEYPNEVSIQRLIMVENQVWAGCNTGLVKIWRVSGEPLTDLQAHEHRIYTMMSVGDTGWTAAADSSVRIWSCKTHTMLHMLQSTDGPVLSMILVKSTKDADIVWIGTAGGVILMCSWNKVTSTLTVDKKHKVAGATIISYMATVSNDHVWLASERMVFVLNIQSLQIEASWRAHDRPILSVLHYNDFVWTCSTDNNIHIWADKTRHLKKSIKVQDTVNCLLGVKDVIWAGSYSGLTLRQSREELKGRHKDSVNSITETWKNREVWTGSTSKDKAVCVWRFN